MLVDDIPCSPNPAYASPHFRTTSALSPVEGSLPHAPARSAACGPSTRWILRFACLFLGLLAGGGLSRAQDPAKTQDSSSGEPTFSIPTEPSGVELVDGVNLETPQACVEHFILSARQGLWQDAAVALDFRLSGNLDEARKEELARRFFYVLNQELWIDWDRVPDRADGLIADPSLGRESPMIGTPRRGIRLGSISAGDRPIPISVHRLRPSDDHPPVWRFSAQTVDNIDALWSAHGPSWLARQMPSWARERGYMRLPAWQWIGLLLTLVLAPVVGYGFGTLASRWCDQRYSPAVAHLCATLKWPVTMTLSSLMIWLVLSWVLGLPSEVATVLEPLALILFVSAMVWLVMRMITFFIDRVLKTQIRHHHDEETVSRGRLLTRVAVVRHVILLVLALLGIAVILLQLDIFHTIGVTMLTSAGALAVILSIAGRAVLGNLIAGLQIALAQPFRIGDTVYVEGNWGQIEDITYVDVIIRTWDHRRLVFPVGYFSSNWFENWSKNDPYLIQAIYLKLDYRADVDKIRQKFIEIAKEDEDWLEGRDEPKVLVTEFNDETMTVRLTCGAANPSRAWSLICRCREKIMRWLQDFEDGSYLPRRRISATASDPRSATAAGAKSDEGPEHRGPDGNRPEGEPASSCPEVAAAGG